MKKGIKARPHDIQRIVELFNPQLVEIHASSEDLMKSIDGEYKDIHLAVHLPEYNGDELLDASSPDETIRLKTSDFYQKAIDKARDWADKFKGTPKVIIHPGGWSNEPRPITERPALIEQLAKTMSEFNDKGVDLLVENMPPHPWFYGGQWACNIFMEPRECRDLCLGMGWGFCYDLCHAALWCASVKNTVTLDRYTEMIRPVLAHVHVSGAHGVDGEGIQIGEGDIDMTQSLLRIQSSSAAFVPEIWQGHKDDYAGFKIAWEKLYAILSAKTE